jgi:hypothetical protein
MLIGLIFTNFQQLILTSDEKKKSGDAGQIF